MYAPHLARLACREEQQAPDQQVTHPPQRRRSSRPVKHLIKVFSITWRRSARQGSAPNAVLSNQGIAGQDMPCQYMSMHTQYCGHASNQDGKPVTHTHTPWPTGKHHRHLKPRFSSHAYDARVYLVWTLFGYYLLSWMSIFKVHMPEGILDKYM